MQNHSLNLMQSYLLFGELLSYNFYLFIFDTSLLLNDNYLMSLMNFLMSLMKSKHKNEIHENKTI